MNLYTQVKEVDMGLAADVGTLARLPKVIGSQSLVRDLCYTCRKLGADEAERCGFVSGVFKDRERFEFLTVNKCRTIQII